MVRGFAFVDSDGNLDINTVYSTERGAKVNAIVRITNLGVIPMDNWPDHVVDRRYQELVVDRGKGTIVHVKVEIENS